MDFDYFLPPNPATLVTIVTQSLDGGKSVEISVPAGAIKSGIPPKCLVRKILPSTRNTRS
jgi:hypothetical protein